MVKKGFVLCFLVLSVAFTHAQNARDMDLILDAKEISYAQAARFILPAAGISADTDEAASFKTAVEKGLLPAKVEAEQAVTTGKLSLFLLKSFGLKGGIMYSLFPNGRYAYRELYYLRCVPDSSDPYAKVTGEQFLHILGRILDYTGEGE